MQTDAEFLKALKNTVFNNLNVLGHKPSVKLITNLAGKLDFDPYNTGLPTSGNGYNKGDTTKLPFINWAVDTHFELLLKHYDLTFEGSIEEKEETKPETKPDAKQKRKIDLSNLTEILEEILNSNDKSVDREEVKGIVNEVIQPVVKEAVSNIQPQMIIIDKVKKAEYKTDGAVNKKVFERCIKLANQPEHSNGMLVGPAGSGKTHIIGQVAKAMGREFVTLSVTAGISESHLTGWLLPVGDDGRFIHLDAPFLKAYENGNAVVLLDEMDSADPNVLLCINQALANGGMTVAQRHEKAYVKRGNAVTIFGACNTYGNGADHRYTGRETLDLSTLDRFDIIEMDYDRAMEKALCGANHVVLEWANHIRKVISKNSLDRIFSTRKVLNYYGKIEGGQYTLDECKEFYFAGWSKDDKALVA